MCKVYCPPFYLVYNSGWSCECVSLLSVGKTVNKYAGQIGKKHKVVNVYADGYVSETQYHWIVRDSLGQTVDPVDIDNAVRQEKLRKLKLKGYFEKKKCLQVLAFAKNLPIPYANPKHKYSLAARTVQSYIQHHRLYSAFCQDFRFDDYFEYGKKLKKFKKPNLKHEPYSDYSYQRSNRSWKHFRKHQWK